jgi:hypothetical protein
LVPRFLSFTNVPTISIISILLSICCMVLGEINTCLLVYLSKCNDNVFMLKGTMLLTQWFLRAPGLAVCATPLRPLL